MGRRKNIVTLLLITLLLLAAGGAAQAATYYISPNGNNSNPGTSAAPWRTFAFAIPRLNPGDTLFLKDGVYTTAANGYNSSTMIFANCTRDARRGAAGAPITVRAENERKAEFRGNGDDDGIYVRNCSYWSFEGITITSRDNTAGRSSAVAAYDSDHIDLRRNLISRSNRWYNGGGITYVNTHQSLIEENEFYWFHRHAFTGAGVRNITFRRNYANGRDYPDIGDMLDSGLRSGNPAGGDVMFEMYPAADSIVENNISENNMGALGMPASARHIGDATRNKMCGNISLNDVMGAKADARGNTLEKMPHDNYYENNVFINPRNMGTYMRSVKNAIFKNNTVFGGQVGGFIHDDNGSASKGDGNPSAFHENALAVGNGGTYGFNFVNQDNFAIRNANVTGYSRIANPASSPNYTNITSINPQLGSCKVFIPDTSPMKGAGTGGDDIGGSVLCRYENCTLTQTQLWNWSTGQFSCGAIVPGVNDIPGQSCFDVHRRLNVNANGCTLPVTPSCRQPAPPQPPPPGGGGSTPPGIGGGTCTIITTEDVLCAPVGATVPLNIDLETFTNGADNNRGHGNDTDGDDDDNPGN